MKKKSSHFVTIFYYVEDTVYIYSWKKNGKFFTHFGDALCKKYIFFIARGAQLHNRVNPRGMVVWNRNELFLNVVRNLSYLSPFIHVG